MRKFIMGVIVGALLFSGAQVFADQISRVGKKVGSEAELYLDGKRMSDVIIVDKQSYAPIRELAEGLGRSVMYNPSETGKKAVISLSVSEDQSKERIKSITERISIIENEIESIEQNGDELKQKFEDLVKKDPNLGDQVSQTLSDDQAQRSKRIAELDEELKGLKIELEALESTE